MPFALANGRVNSMFNRYFSFSKNNSLDTVAKIICASVFLCLLCPLKLLVQSPIPITLQSFAVILVAISLGSRIGFASALIYVVLGIGGVPVFAGYNSGIEIVLGPSMGFFLGFLLTSPIIGYSAERKENPSPLFILRLWFWGHIIIIFCGIFFIRQEGDGDWRFLQFIIPGAVVKIIVGSISTYFLLKFFMRKKFN